eukprot:15430694-Alexandrium_andersonii.AAC.1
MTLSNNHHPLTALDAHQALEILLGEIREIGVAEGGPSTTGKPHEAPRHDLDTKESQSTAIHLESK